MTFEWYPQITDQRTKCSQCCRVIPPFTTYYRAVIEADGVDEFGSDVCAKCRKDLPSDDEKRDQ